MNQKEALQLGMAKYSNGRSCKRGHTPLRYATTGKCVGCVAHYAKHSHAELRKARAARYLGKVRRVYDLAIEDAEIVDKFVENLAFLRFP